MRTLLMLFTALITLAHSTAHAIDGRGQNIVIIDSGITTGALGSSRITEQLCWSKADKISSDSTTAGTGFVHYEIASVCKNGLASDFTNRNAATVPRIKPHNFSELYDNHHFGARHGTKVFEEAFTVAGRANYTIVANTYYDANATVMVGDEEVQCGPHGPLDTEFTFPEDTNRPGDILGCYPVNDAEADPAPFSRFLAIRNLAAINYSATSGGSCNRNNQVFLPIRNDDIAFVASAGNDGPNGAVGYPACNPNVISVGALNADGTVAKETSLQGPIDYFADGITEGELLPATSFAAPIVTGAFALMQSAKSTKTSLKDMNFALRFTAPKCIQHRGECVPVVTRNSAREAAICIREGTCVNTDPPSIGDIGYEDNGQYGSSFGDTSTEYEIDLDFSDFSSAASSVASKEVVSSNEATITAPNERDVVISFKTKMSDTRSQGNGIDLLLNNFRLEQTPFHEGEGNFSFTINRNRFSTCCRNLIKLKPRSTSRAWGITQIKAEMNPVVELTVDQTDTKEYGYSRTPALPTGLRTSFEVPSVDTDYLLSVTGWDIDVADETQVFVNGRSIGFLTKGLTSSSYSPRDTFILRRAILTTGVNSIEFVQRSPGGIWTGFEFEKWAVRDILVQKALPNLSAESVKIEDATLKETRPFSANATIRNIGAGTSVVGSTVRFYASTDKTFDSGDTVLATVPFAPLLESQERTVNTSIQTPFVNQKYFFGFCVDPVPTESLIDNNCSDAIRLRSVPNIAPIIMLLDDDEPEIPPAP